MSKTPTNPTDKPVNRGGRPPLPVQDRRRSKGTRQPIAGQDPKTGKFVKGNKVAVQTATPVQTVQRMRQVILTNTRECDIKTITKRVVDAARKGDLKAALMLFDVIGLRNRVPDATVPLVDREDAMRRVAALFQVATVSLPDTTAQPPDNQLSSPAPPDEERAP